MKKIMLFFLFLMLPILCEARQIDTIIIHHTSVVGDETDYSVEQIRQWHLKRGFKDIGYHFIIRRTGEIEAGRALSLSGAHAKHRNKNSIGIALVGYAEFTLAQYNSLKTLLGELTTEYGIRKIERHHDKCPGKSVDVEILDAIFSKKKEFGYASWYVDKETASGERFSSEALTCASRFYAIGTKLKITSVSTQRSVIVKVNDIGPSEEMTKRDRIIDLTKRAFKKLAPLDKGLILVRVERIYE